jgi:hypothetical protein
MNANTPDTMGYENMKALLNAYFEENKSILEIDDDSLRDSCMFCHCISQSECQCDCEIYLDVQRRELHVVIGTCDGLVLGDGPQGNKFGACYIRKNGALFFVTKIFADARYDVWQREYNYDDYWFQEP